MTIRSIDVELIILSTYQWFVDNSTGHSRCFRRPEWRGRPIVAEKAFSWRIAHYTAAPLLMTRARDACRGAYESASEPRRRTANLVIFPARRWSNKSKGELRAYTQLRIVPWFALIRSRGVCRGKTAELFHSEDDRGLAVDLGQIASIILAANVRLTCLSLFM